MRGRPSVPASPRLLEQITDGLEHGVPVNLADAYRRLGSFDAATEHINAAKEHAPNLRQDAYGAFLRTALDEVAEAISRRDTTKRPSAPGSTA